MLLKGLQAPRSQAPALCSFTAGCCAFLRHCSGCRCRLPRSDEKPYDCDLCDFVTSDSAFFALHVKDHQEGVRNASASRASKRTVTPAGSDTERGSHSSYPKLRKALLQQQIHQSAPYSRPGAAPSTNQNSTDSRSGAGIPGGGGGQTRENCSLDATPLNLAIQSDDRRGGPSLLQDDGLVRHRCSYCSYVTHYPEVLWMHQTVSHKINSSALAPKWATRTSLKAPKEGQAFQRRTGPPPALGGKDCPSLPSGQASRTRPRAGPIQAG
ncbi:hypothetical protein AAFF_G00163760 [Aldrovandia affinis]|uniref:C2H2-type domain-containing protein n=1 Tax=Aldrovandia affinis TaxID=143900 RepID=A0AAD7WWI2_9TELE|nr:hypothetical protein AAFF_G00163760 [Aldrovandia affinis]